MALRFRKHLINDLTFESAGVMDVNSDGLPDIVCGAHWYEGPDFRKIHPVGPIMQAGEYFDDFSTIPMDVNGNGRPDFITGGWFGETLRWRENPGDPDKEWPLHDIAKTGNIESTRAWDIDGDGQIEIVPNCPGRPLIAYKLIIDAKGKGRGAFSAHTLWEGPQGHGLGFGDINGNGRGDLVVPNGWLEAPSDPLNEPWTFHPEFQLLQSASVPILVVDVNGDGVNDLIVGGSHEYGLYWWEQKRDGDTRTWIKHPIDPWCSQYHDMIWADIDGDGQCELITGKRYRAHCGGDPGWNEGTGIYYFKWNGENFTKEVIDFGPPRQGTGLGIHFAVADLTGDGRLDIVAPGKDGLYVFFNEG